ncbi:hypothetical protein KP509_13G094900 [Ceratopteris richardii]|uniref:dolichyl-P-Man:Man5GlcNAc2-PP-dolichol alpha-1,3-mannosyltransferase n=1 Tax=Ceratopteris richardii TaxID=49495 RepID=A0A8T2TLC6_CERRI|nr:hypothetical protein KP509_13G094900 [Ceratopteris richardii]
MARPRARKQGGGMIQLLKSLGQDDILVLTICSLVLFDSLLTALIIVKVPYTKIDWDAYMSQVDGFVGGERNYSNLRGDTGPLVYPAGFLYIYSAIQYITKGIVANGQVVFGLLYILNLAVVFAIYHQAKLLPFWAFCLLCLSKRIHSIFVLRLFNDCIASTLAHTSILLFQKNKWKSGMVVFSLAVSVKMNVLLYAPSLLLLMFKGLDLVDISANILLAAVVQVLLGMPFLLVYPWEYVSKAFDLGRVFIHFWSVNFKFVPEAVFVSKGFALALLALHLSLLIVFAQFRWCKYEQGLLPALKLQSKLHQIPDLFFLKPMKSLRKEDKSFIDPRHIATVLFTGNFIGILCARSLHYQFYSWYFHSLPYLLWITSYPTLLRLIILLVIEVCWNVYPSTCISSLALLLSHVLLLVIFLMQRRMPKHFDYS